MNTTEFNQWKNDYFTAFPETGAWINQSPHVLATLKHWQTALATVELADALEVTQRLLRGDDEPIKAFEREQTPAVIRRLASAQSHRRKQPAKADDSLPEYMTAGLPKPSFESGPLLRKLVEASAKGATKEELAKLMPEIPNADRNRYRCLLCRDTGTLQVWSGTSTAAVLDGTFGQPRTVYAIEVRCTCVWYSERYPSMRQFDDGVMIPCPRGPRDAEHINELKYRAEKMAASAKVQEFDADTWGQQFE